MAQSEVILFNVRGDVTPERPLLDSRTSDQMIPAGYCAVGIIKIHHAPEGHTFTELLDKPCLADEYEPLWERTLAEVRESLITWS